MSARVEALRQHIPSGAGVGLRHELWDQTLEHADAFDFVEITIDDYLHVPPKHLKKWFAPVLERWSIVAHGVGLSLGSSHGLDAKYLDDVARLLDALKIEVYTEHLSWRRSATVEIGQFMPTPFTEAWAACLAQHIEQVQRHLGRTMAVENITYLLGTFDSGIGEARYITNILEEADCGLLLDVTNLLINSANLHADPNDWAAIIPPSRLALSHMAGGHVDQHHYIDSHGHPIPAPVYEALSWFGAHSPLRSALLERDKNWPTIQALIDEVATIRKSLTSTSPPNTIPTLPTLLPPIALNTRDVDVDHIEPMLLQDTQAYLLQHPEEGRYARTHAALPTAYQRATCTEDDARVLIDYILTIPKRRWRVFQKILSFKRREKLESVLPGTFKALRAQELLHNTLQDYFQHVPDQGLSRVEDAQELTLYISTHLQDHRFILDLNAHEFKVLALKQRPWRLFSELKATLWPALRRANTLTLAHHAHDLDRYAHHDMSNIRTGRFTATYRRKPKGVYVNVFEQRA